MPDIFSISELNTHIGRLLGDDELLRDAWITGEISNMTRARSGHWYFTLKDDTAQMRCVMWRSNAERQSVNPREGDQIVVHGNVSLYQQRGDVQFYADFMRAAGVGDLYAEFEALKEKLAAEGLFEAVHKQALPGLPLRIGVVTSANAAALQDVLNVLRRRLPLAEVLLSPTLVQGTQAPAQIAAAVERLDVFGGVDVMLLVRGGGSIEDLWAFNDEGVARAVFNARTPIVAGVGHETDFTIVDFVADLRAPTPSAAAEAVSPDLSGFVQVLQQERERLLRLAQANIDGQRSQLDAARSHLRLLSPAGRVRDGRQRVDELYSRLGNQQAAHLARLRERLAATDAALEAASPGAILQRGYAIVRRADGAAADATTEPGTLVEITLADGTLQARVETSENHDQ